MEEGCEVRLRGLEKGGVGDDGKMIGVGWVYGLRGVKCWGEGEWSSEVLGFV